VRHALLALALLVLSGLARAAPRGEARLLHVPPSERRVEQGILTAVPITVDLPADLEAARVLVHFKVHGSKDWTTLELYREAGQRFRGAIPCLEVSTITGDLRYYVRVHDTAGEVIAYRGSRSEPFVVRVLHESERPELASGGRCPDPADCPRGLLAQLLRLRQPPDPRVRVEHDHFAAIHSASTGDIRPSSKSRLPRSEAAVFGGSGTTRATGRPRFVTT
jgi:hypothetical protein